MPIPNRPPTDLQISPFHYDIHYDTAITKTTIIPSEQLNSQTALLATKKPTKKPYVQWSCLDDELTYQLIT